MADRTSKIETPSIIPGGERAPAPGSFDYYYDQAREICRRVSHKDHLTDDEIIVLAMVACQLALAKFVEPGKRDAENTLNAILNYLDHNEVIAAVSSKMDRLLEGNRGQTREGAPALKQLGLDLGKDPDEPAGR
jgi:hypothetical protein